MTGKKDEPIIPITPFTTNASLAPYQPFTDAKTGNLYKDATQLYWQTLDKTVDEYIDHPESKFENGSSIGKMRRQHVQLKLAIYIGKEGNELEETEVLGLDEDTYVQYLPTVTCRNKED